MPMQASLTEQLIALERRLHACRQTRSRGDLEALLAEDFVEIGASGRVYDKQGVIDALLAAAPVTLHAEDFQCREPAPGMALLIYRTVSGVDDMRREAARSSLWRRQGAHWRLLFHQGTVLSAGA